MDISTLYNINSDAIRNAATSTSTKTAETAGDGNGFGNFLSAAVNQLNETNKSHILFRFLFVTMFLGFSF